VLVWPVFIPLIHVPPVLSSVLRFTTVRGWSPLRSVVAVRLAIVRMKEERRRTSTSVARSCAVE
jgi:hypothetical protein